jgi:hypothetical protein
MKTIKSALLGTKTIIDRNNDVMLHQLREILKEHRALVINRLLGDLPTYLDYKFQVKPTKDLVAQVHDKLLILRNGQVDLDKYQPVVLQMFDRALIHLTNEPFYNEIDGYLMPYVKDNQLKLV